MRARGAVAALALLATACGADAEVAPATTEAVDEEDPPGVSTTLSPGPTSGSTVASTLAEIPPGASDPVWYGDHISVGDCFDDTYDEDGEWEFTDVPPFVDCAEPHHNQAYHVFTLGDGTGAFPGDEAFDDHAAEVCRSELELFLGAEIGTGGIDWWWGWPLEEQWEQGARQAFCAVYLPDARTSGSLEGVGRRFRPAELPEVAPVPEGAVYDHLGSSEDGDRVASFLMPQSALDEAAEAAVTAARAAGLSPEGLAGTDEVFVFRFQANGITYTVTLHENPDGEIEWWLYFPPE